MTTSFKGHQPKAIEIAAEIKTPSIREKRNTVLYAVSSLISKASYSYAAIIGDANFEFNLAIQHPAGTL